MEVLSRQTLGKGQDRYFDQEAFGKRLKELRNIKGMTQEELAEKVNITREHLGTLLHVKCEYRLSPSWKESGPRPGQKAASAGHQPAVGHRKEHVKGLFEVSILNDKFNDKPIRIGYNRAGGFCLSS